MTPSCGRTYGYGFNLHFIKSCSSTSTLTSPTSSTTSETTNSPQSQSIFTTKPRTLRKRLNQTYNEAATLLSTAHPNLFSAKNLIKPQRFTKPLTEHTNDSSEPLLLFREYHHNDNGNGKGNGNGSDAFSFLREGKRGLRTGPNKAFFGVREKPCEFSAGIANCDEFESEDFDCESILDEEIDEGIDSIMGGRVEDGGGGGGGGGCGEFCCGGERRSPWFGVRALRRVEDASWWNFLVVDMVEISPGMKKDATEGLVPATEKKNNNNKKKKKKKKVKKELAEMGVGEGLLLKLNYDDVRNAWSDRGSPFAGGSPGNGVAGSVKSKRKKDTWTGN
ncbi:protein CHLOROPLAST IMPORT APPARATUS 2 [Cajanus cajan]|uniref:protein CHLOROPLAST IMPORT APPARATUS 2 n=1 Tax=Cajanus cajan TaxID=3821 RepID=UPI00098D7A53|nr:protein CHLOROPLAST IMPORT APPARATUS 2 [Cajanus cajan]